MLRQSTFKSFYTLYTIGGACNSNEQLEKNLNLAIDVYIKRVSGAPCGNGTINLLKGSSEVWDVHSRHMVKNLPEQCVFTIIIIIPCFQKSCPHVKCQAGEDKLELKWFPNGPSLEYFPIPIPDPNRPWVVDCSKCKATCAGHFLPPDDHLAHYRNHGIERMMVKLLKNYWRSLQDALHKEDAAK